MISHNLAIAAIERGEIARREKHLLDAEKNFTEAIKYFRELGSSGDLAHAITRRAQIKRDQLRYEDALSDQKAALAIYRSMDDKGRLPNTVRHLADILQSMERHTDAEPYYLEMLALYEASPDTPPLEMANAMRSVALHAEHMGDLHKSQRLWSEIRDRYAALGSLFFEMTGKPDNPGVAESDRRLAALAVRIAESGQT
jgi:tetratricopeptide (TPR) repeat protein